MAGEYPMSTMRQAAEDYLALRRAIGFKLEHPGRLVLQFAEHLDRLGTDKVTIDLAVGWARQPAHADPRWWAYRLSAVRGFTAYLHPRMPGIEIPPTDLMPSRTYRATPYLYSTKDIEALMTAARGLRSPMVAATYETLIGLMAVTGMRVGEAINLDRTDVDLTAAMLVIGNGKFGKSRHVPLHPSTAAALREYARHRGRLLPLPTATNFFLSTAGTRLSVCRVESTFRDLVRHAGLQPRSARCRPRLHHLRHSFAVNTVLDWYRRGADVQAKMPLLSTFLGHVDPSATYWYLSGAPELMTLACARLEQNGEQS
jgi:integrase/recombinase XerD